MPFRIKHSAKERLIRLPHGLGFNLYRVLFWKDYKKNQAKRKRPVEQNSYSLKPFDDCHSIFIRIPKCGTQAISTSLFGNLGYGHRTIMQYRLFYDPSTFQNYFKFAFVRNPMTRLASAYFFLRKGGFSRRDKAFNESVLSKYVDFEDFVLHGLSSQDIATYIHFLPQWHFVCDSKGRLAVDFVGKIEQADQDFEYVCSRLGVKKTLSKRNVTQGKIQPYEEMFTDEMKKVVEHVYSKDFELFGYSSL